MLKEEISKEEWEELPENQRELKTDYNKKEHYYLIKNEPLPDPAKDWPDFLRRNPQADNW